MKENLIRNGRYPNSRIWRGSSAQDSFGKEWEQNFWGLAKLQTMKMDATVDTCGMREQAFKCEDVTKFDAERVQHEISDAFASADSIHKDCMQLDMEDRLG